MSDKQIDKIQTKWIVGMTMKMVNNCYLNMGKEEFEDFLENYDKFKHEYEPDMNKCDACNGVDISTDEINKVLSDIVMDIIGSDINPEDAVNWNKNELTVYNRVKFEQRIKASQYGLTIK